MKKLVRQMVRFGVVGIVSFLLDCLLMIVFKEMMHMNILMATTISYTISVIFNYKVSTMYVFAVDESRGKKKIFFTFSFLSIIALILNEILMFGFAGILLINYIIAKILATMNVTIFNFITRKMFIEARSRMAY
ncbi:GtrA family protein [Floccifex sp.]|uniref:GtrA family protein n=1 Tax=Floccifex sp. TaxID=2815810 RepID=UPI003F0F5C96